MVVLYTEDVPARLSSGTGIGTSLEKDGATLGGDAGRDDKPSLITLRSLDEAQVVEFRGRLLDTAVGQGHAEDGDPGVTERLCRHRGTGPVLVGVHVVQDHGGHHGGERVLVAFDRCLKALGQFTPRIGAGHARGGAEARSRMMSFSSHRAVMSSSRQVGSPLNTGSRVFAASAGSTASTLPACASAASRGTGAAGPPATRETRLRLMDMGVLSGRRARSERTLSCGPLEVRYRTVSFEIISQHDGHRGHPGSRALLGARDVVTGLPGVLVGQPAGGGIRTPGCHSASASAFSASWSRGRRPSRILATKYSWPLPGHLRGAADGHVTVTVGDGRLLDLEQAELHRPLRGHLPVRPAPADEESLRRRTSNSSSHRPARRCRAGSSPGHPRGSWRRKWRQHRRTGPWGRPAGPARPARPAAARPRGGRCARPGGRSGLGSSTRGRRASGR